MCTCQTLIASGASRTSETCQMHRTKIPPCYNCSGPLCVVERTGQTASSPQRNSIPRASVKSTRPEALCARASSQYSDVQPEAATSTQPTGGSESASKRTFLQRVKAFFLADRIDRKRLAELGLGAVASVRACASLRQCCCRSDIRALAVHCSAHHEVLLLQYGFVSNATYGTGMAVSWVAFVKQYGVSPLMPGQWKAFMAWYAGIGPQNAYQSEQVSWISLCIGVGVHTTFSNSAYMCNSRLHVPAACAAEQSLPALAVHL